ncbi:MAG: DNA-binding protein [Nitrospinota bacterium]
MKSSYPRSSNRMIPPVRFQGMHRQRLPLFFDEGARMFDDSKIETVKGTVLSAEHSHSQKGGRSYSVHFLLKTDDGLVTVYLGPAWYLDRQRVKIRAKDLIEVTGSRVAMDGTDALIAVEIKKGNEILKLRDKSGAASWGRTAVRR